MPNVGRDLWAVTCIGGPMDGRDLKTYAPFPTVVRFPITHGPSDLEPWTSVVAWEHLDAQPPNVGEAVCGWSEYQLATPTVNRLIEFRYVWRIPKGYPIQ